MNKLDIKNLNFELLSTDLYVKHFWECSKSYVSNLNKLDVKCLSSVLMNIKVSDLYVAWTR